MIDSPDQHGPQKLAALLQVVSGGPMQYIIGWCWQMLPAGAAMSMLATSLYPAPDHFIASTHDYICMLQFQLYMSRAKPQVVDWLGLLPASIRLPSIIIHEIVVHAARSGVHEQSKDAGSGLVGLAACPPPVFRSSSPRKSPCMLRHQVCMSRAKRQLLDCLGLSPASTCLPLIITKEVAMHAVLVGVCEQSKAAGARLLGPVFQSSSTRKSPCMLCGQVYVSRAKRQVLDCLGLPPAYTRLLTTNDTEADMHAVPLSMASLKAMARTQRHYRSRFTTIVGFQPTGWSHTSGMSDGPQSFQACSTWSFLQP